MFRIRSMFAVMTLMSFFGLLWAGSFATGCSPAPNDEKSSETTSGGETTAGNDGGTTNTESTTGSEPTETEKTQDTETNNSEPVAETEPDAGPATDAGSAPETAAEAGSGGDLSYAKHIEPIFQKAGCMGPYCHGTQKAAGLYLEKDGYNNLVNKKSKSGVWTLVVPGDAAKSLIYEKVSKEKPAEGSQMPLGNSKLTAAQIKTIGDWITQGAKP